MGGGHLPKSSWPGPPSSNKQLCPSSAIRSSNMQYNLSPGRHLEARSPYSEDGQSVSVGRHSWAASASPHASRTSASMEALRHELRSPAAAAAAEEAEVFLEPLEDVSTIDGTLEDGTLDGTLDDGTISESQ